MVYLVPLVFLMVASILLQPRFLVLFLARLSPRVRSVRFAQFRILLNTASGSILILHDGADRGRRTARVLDGVLPRLHRRSIRAATLSETIEAALGTECPPS